MTPLIVSTILTKSIPSNHLSAILVVIEYLSENRDIIKEDIGQQCYIYALNLAKYYVIIAKVNSLNI
jgi:hypothetical protein